MWRFRKINLSIPQRLWLLTIIPVMGMIAAGAMSFSTVYSEYRGYDQDARSLTTFHHEVSDYVAIADLLSAERDAGLQLTAHRENPQNAIDYRSRFAATDQAVAAMMAKLERLAQSPQAGLFTFANSEIRSFVPGQLADARAGALENKHTGGEICQIYLKLELAALHISEGYRGMIHTPPGLNIFDAVAAMQKIHQQEFVVASLIKLGLENGGLPKDELAIIRRQFFDSTENEYYLFKFQPEIRAVFKATTRKTDDEIAFYAYEIDLASTQLDGAPLPPFVPKSQTFAEMYEAHFQAYGDVYNYAFAFADRTLTEIANQRQQRAYLIGAALIAGICLSLGLNLAITRSTSGSLVNVSNNIAQASGDVKAASTQLTAAGNQISQDATHYALAIEKISSNLNEVSAVAESNKNYAAKATTFTTRARDSVDAGLTTIVELDGAMNSARNSAQKINQIIERINDLSFQTNLLALNAAVEAGRAGAAGAGFAVVADEVRRLAGRCAEAAKETAELIGDSSKDTATAITKSDELAARFKSVSSGIHEVNEIVTLISTNFIQQASSIGEISHSVSKQRKIAQSLAAAAQETASTALSMENQVESLKLSVERMDSMLGKTYAKSAENDSGPFDFYAAPEPELQPMSDSSFGN